MNKMKYSTKNMMKNTVCEPNFNQLDFSLRTAHTRMNMNNICKAGKDFYNGKAAHTHKIKVMFKHLSPTRDNGCTSVWMTAWAKCIGSSSVGTHPN